MDIVYEEMIENATKTIHKKQDKKIVLFGCENRFAKLYQQLKKEGVYSFAFWRDDNVSSAETYQGTPVITLKELKELENVLLVAFEDQQEVLKNLKLEGADHEIIVLPNEKTMDVLNGKEKINYLIKKIKVYQDSYKTYKTLLNKYNAKQILVFSGQSGDLFNALTYLKEYVRAANLENDYVLTVVGVPCYKVAKMFEITNVEKIDALATKKLIKLYELCDDINIIPIHSSEAHVKNTVYTKLIRRENITLGKMYKYQAFKLNEVTKPQLPVYIRNSTYVEELFDRGKYPENRTVLVSPYANSYMDDDLLKEWEILCDWLSQQGYRVLTNSAGECEPPIKGTEAIWIPLEYITDFVERGGWFIGIRSGLCDIISGAKCKKIIFYKEDLYGRGDYTAYHSLKGMGLCDDAIEIKYCRDTQKNVFENVRTHFCI